MQFLHPYWLFGLLAIAVPVIIHLFNFRRYRKYYFTNLKLLKSIKRETKKQHRLRHLLILLSRILTITFLVLAFARPFIPGPEGVQRSEVNRVSIYVDNSMSMQATESGHSLLDEALARAAEVVDAYGPSDRFQLITNDFEGKHQPYYNHDEIIQLLSEVRISPVRRTMDEVHERLLELRGNGPGKVHFFVISDFQRSTTRLDGIAADSTLVTFLVSLLETAPPNVYIDSCYMESPFNHIDQQQELIVHFVNASDVDLQKIPVRLVVNGKQRALSAFDIPGNGKAEVKLPFTQREAGQQAAEISIDDYPVTWDDHMFLAWKVKERIPVLVIGEKEAGFYFRTLFTGDSLFEYNFSQIRQLDYNRFAGVDLVILDNVSQLSSGLARELERYVEEGGSLFLIPSENVELQNFNTLLADLSMGRLKEADTGRLMVTGLNTGHELFADVFESMPKNPDLPVSTFHFPLADYRTPGNHIIMDLQNGDPYLLARIHGKGRVYLLASPAGDHSGNLVRHALWVPLMYRMAMLSRPQDELFYTLGRDQQLSATSISLAGDLSLRMSLRGEGYEFIPGTRSDPSSTTIYLYDQVRRAGFYDLMAGTKLLDTYAFNYDRHESNPAIYSREELENLVESREESNLFLLSDQDKPVYQSISELNKGKGMWKLFIWLALLFIVTEILLLRWFR